MIKLTKKQQKTAGDLVIGLGILGLAFLLKDASPEEKTSGMITVIAAIFLRFKMSKSARCTRNTNAE